MRIGGGSYHPIVLFPAGVVLKMLLVSLLKMSSPPNTFNYEKQKIIFYNIHMHIYTYIPIHTFSLQHRDMYSHYRYITI